MAFARIHSSRDPHTNPHVGTTGATSCFSIYSAIASIGVDRCPLTIVSFFLRLTSCARQTTKAGDGPGAYDTRHVSACHQLHGGPCFLWLWYHRSIYLSRPVGSMLIESPLPVAGVQDKREKQRLAQRLRVYNTLSVPASLERLVMWGTVLCTDSFLFIFTLLPL